jgi:hypothetical protein
MMEIVDFIRILLIMDKCKYCIHVYSDVDIHCVVRKKCKKNNLYCSMIVKCDDYECSIWGKFLKIMGFKID